MASRYDEFEFDVEHAAYLKQYQVYIMHDELLLITMPRVLGPTHKQS